MISEAIEVICTYFTHFGVLVLLNMTIFNNLPQERMNAHVSPKFALPLYFSGRGPLNLALDFVKK